MAAGPDDTGCDIPWQAICTNANFTQTIHTFQRLGVRFIWIDSTCIIQGWGEIGTPELDWNKQALPMHNLNRNFHCNIAAAELKGYTGVLFCEQTSSVLPIHNADDFGGSPGRS
ncbi:hypothetical protein CH063_00335 [Colletotrichum higginsianum]|uniref:Heterokaryon incompatibility domain-containing protein n=1 Tax=Colletotrichum higginsianum (strain IMI 349063) TaxID=759273 RepID=H1VIA3_COLHI|nr:hypothetical protein CH063_00335 [Colletotrichum higginsianum]